MTRTIGFNIASLQEQGMTKDQINKYIRDKEREMYGESGGTSEPSTPREVYPTKTEGFDTVEPSTLREVYPTKSDSSDKKKSFQELLDSVKQNKTRTAAPDKPIRIEKFEQMLQALGF